MIFTVRNGLLRSELRACSLPRVGIRGQKASSGVLRASGLLGIEVSGQPRLLLIVTSDEGVYRPFQEQKAQVARQHESRRGPDRLCNAESYLSRLVSPEGPEA